MRSRSNGITILTLTNVTQTVWSVDSQDWKEPSAAGIVRRVTSTVRPGSIVLFHSAAPHTAEALPEIIEYLIRSGYAIVPVSRLLLQGAFEIDGTGRQVPVE